MLELAQPWGLLLLPLPLLMRLLPPYREHASPVRVPFFETLLLLTGAPRTQGAAIRSRRRLQAVLLAVSWSLLVLAAARPTWVEEPIERKRSGRDLMVAVDLSGSMETRDFTLADGSRVDRLEALKHVLADLAGQRDSDRLGLIVFGDAAYLQAPFTEDQRLWRQLLMETATGMAGQSTVLGDAIGLAIKHFAESPSKHRVLLLLTDGNDTGSRVPPIEAAKVAASEGIRIYPVAIGDPGAAGEDALDLDTLQRIAQISGGQDFQALERHSLEAASRTIAALEPALYETVSFRPRQSLHWVPVAGVALLYALYHGAIVLSLWRRKNRQGISRAH